MAVITPSDSIEVKRINELTSKVLNEADLANYEVCVDSSSDGESKKSTLAQLKGLFAAGFVELDENGLIPNTIIKNYQLYQPNQTNPFVYTNNSGVLTINGSVGINYSIPVDALGVRGTIGVIHPSDNVQFTSLTPSYFGFSTIYRALVIGETTGNKTVSIGYNPISNASGSFSGNGIEVLFRNGVEFTTPNSTNDSFHRYVLVLKDNKVGIGTNSPGSKLAVVGLPTSASGLSTGDFFTQTATQLGGSGTTKVVCVV